jgi:transcriptional regulator NrdR family protein
MPRTPTQLWCPKCQSIQPCRVADSRTTRDYTGETERRFYKTEQPDINWYRRVRICDSCGDFFTTAEIEEEFLTELVRLRRNVSELRGKIETHKIAAATATQALDELTSAIGALIGR